jgi:hypothetical protein
MKRFSMLILSLVLGSLGFAFAQRFAGIPYLATDVEFTDKGFVYTPDDNNTDADYGYIHLSRSEDIVMVTLNNTADGGIKLSFPEITELDKDKVKDGDYNQDFIDTYYQEAAGIEVGNLSIDIAFQDALLEDVTNYFVDQLKAMNFNPVDVGGTANTYAFDCGCNVNARFHLRATFTQLGNTVYAHLSVVL